MGGETLMVTPDIEPFYAMALLARAKELESQGRDIVHMEIGEPDFPTPPRIVEAATRFIAAGDVKYTSAAGLPALRHAIADFYARRYGVEVPARRVFVVPGASGGFLLALAALVQSGDEVLLSDPGYPCYPNFVRVFGGVPVGVPAGAEEGFQLGAEALARHWSARAKGAVVASPANPTGTLLDGERLRGLIEFIESAGGFFVSDEIYHGLEYGEPAHSALEFSDRAFAINSFSKYFGMTGWRLGWLIAPEAYVDILERLAQNLFISAPTPSQVAALAAFDADTLAELERRRLEFKARRDFLLTGLERLGFSSPVKPEGAFYVYADSARIAPDSFELAWRLLERAGVAATPGKDFGRNAPERHMRFAYTAGLPRLALALERLSAYLGI